MKTKILEILKKNFMILIELSITNFDSLTPLNLKPNDADLRNFKL